MEEQPAPSSDDPLAQPLDMPDDNEIPEMPNLKNKRSNKPWIWLLILMVLAGLGFAAWKLLKKSPAAQTAVNQTQNTPAKSQSSTNDIPSNTNLKTYDNSQFRYSLSYPDNWTVTEESDGGTRIESPAFTYQTLDGESQGNFKIYIRKGARTNDSKYIGQGVAVQPSEKLKYSDPVPGQRKETDLSFFGYDTPDSFAYFMVTGGFNLKKGDTLGPKYATEQEAYVIAGGYSDSSLKDALGFNRVPVDYFANSEAYKQAYDIIKSLQLN